MQTEERLICDTEQGARRKLKHAELAECLHVFKVLLATHMT